MFKVECLGCQAPYQVDERRVPEKGLKMRCPKCGTTFKVEPPAQAATPSQAPAPEPTASRTAAPPQPFTSGGLDPARNLGKSPGSRDSLARTMIGVSSAEIDALGKETSPTEGKPKAFRIPRPNQGGPEREASAARAPAPPSPPSPIDIDLPATPIRARSLGLTASDGLTDAALPEVVRTEKSSGAPAREARGEGFSSAPTPDAAWISGDDVSDAPVDSKDETVRLRLSDLPLPVAAAARGEIDEADIPAAPEPPTPPLEHDLPALASPQRRPPPRRARPAPPEARASEADLPARRDELRDDLEVDLPAVVAAPPRSLERAPRPPSRQSSARRDELDLPAIARTPEVETEPGGSIDLPSMTRARSAAGVLSDADLPAVGRGQPKPELPSFGRAQPSAALPAVGRPPEAAANPPLAPVPSDLPDVLGDSFAAPDVPSAPEVIALPEVLATALPDVVAPESAQLAKPHDDLPDVLGGYAEAAAAGLPAVHAGGLPEVQGTGLPDVLAAGLPEVHGTGLPDVLAAGLPEVHGTGLPDVLAAGLPEVQGTGLPDVLAAGLPEVHGTGLPDVLAAALPTVSSTALPEVLAPGVSGFGRVDLPLPRPAELPEVRGNMGFDEVDLPGVGESLPSVSENWGEANLPLVGETLPMARGRGGESADPSASPFDAFGPAGDGDPFAGSEADFGAPDIDDPFAVQAGDPIDEFAPGGVSAAGAVPRASRDPGAGYGEVDIGGVDEGDSAIETADDMEFQAIPQRGSAGPARAAASASVHADSPDAEATGSTLELGPERKAPKARTRRLVAAAAVALGTIAGGSLALKPAIGPFGIHFVMDQLNRDEHERMLAGLVSEARAAADRDTLAAVQGALRELEKARAAAPRFEPLSARSAFEHYRAALRFGPLPKVEATAKVALDELDGAADFELARLARGARAAATRAADAKSQLQALGQDLDARQLLGDLALRDADWAAAGKIWNEIAKGDPKSARAAFGVARAELGLGKLTEAALAARQVLALEPEHVGAPILLLEARRAQLAAADGAKVDPVSTDELVAAVQRVLPVAAPGEAALAHCVLGELHASQGRAGLAQQAFEAALVVDRSLPRALIGLGDVLHQASRNSEALARFEAAAKAEPTNLAAQLGVAKAQIQLGRLPEAKAVLTRLAESNKDHPNVIFWTGKAEQALGNHDAAIAAYRASIVASDGSPSAVDAYLALAKLQAELGQLAAAQKTLSEARGKLPPSGVLHKALGEIAMTRAEYAQAYQHFQQALELDSGDTRARFLGATALTRLGRFDEALAAFQSVGQTDKDFPGLAVERGRLFEDSGRNAEALAEFEAALKKTPDDPEVQIRVGCSRVVAGQPAAAQELLEAASKARPRSAEANYCLGRALFDQERLHDALTRLERAISLDGKRAVYHQFRGWVASELGRQGDAQEALDNAIELDRGLADAYWLRGRLRLKQGAARDAIVDLEHALRLKPTRYDALADLAMAYADRGRTQKARDTWERALAKDADNSTWHFRYGKLLSSSGAGAMAAAHLERAVDLVTESSAAAHATKTKPPVWLWQAHYLLGRELGVVPASIPHWQAYLRLSPRDDPYRSEAERALRDLGQPWGGQP